VGRATRLDVFVALEDDLMRLFGGERIQMIMERISGGEDIPLQYGMLSKQIENAQKRLENNNFGIRKHVLDYDDVMNQQRNIIYSQRRQVLMGDDVSANIREMIETLVENALDVYCPKGKYPEEWDWDDLYAYFERVFSVRLRRVSIDEMEHVEPLDFKQEVLEAVREAYKKKEGEMAESNFNMRSLERMVLLRVVDAKWMDHIDAMDQFRGYRLRAFAQRDPIMSTAWKVSICSTPWWTAYARRPYLALPFRVESRWSKRKLRYTRKCGRGRQAGGRARGAPAADGHQPGRGKQAPVRVEKKVGRNEPCPCGSGKKYKNCCGKAE
jgi:preprotein translocase subunit SecA